MNLCVHTSTKYYFSDFSRSIVTSNRIAIIDHEVPGRKILSTPGIEGVTSKSNQLSCDTYNETDSGKLHCRKRNNQCSESQDGNCNLDVRSGNKFTDDDNDSGIELGTEQFSFTTSTSLQQTKTIFTGEHTLKFAKLNLEFFICV